MKIPIFHIFQIFPIIPELGTPFLNRTILKLYDSRFLWGMQVTRSLFRTHAILISSARGRRSMPQPIGPQPDGSQSSKNISWESGLFDDQNASTMNNKCSRAKLGSILDHFRSIFGSLKKQLSQNHFLSIFEAP